ncbi:hypothetical protein ACFVH6_25535 [Spirillospora sp. NPDC127200]
MLDLFAADAVLADSTALLRDASDVADLVKPFVPDEIHNALLAIFAEAIVSFQFGDITEQQARDEITMWGALVLVAA